MKYEYTLKHAKLVNKALLILLVLTIAVAYIGVVQSANNSTTLSNDKIVTAFKKTKIVMAVGLTANKEMVLLNDRGLPGKECSFNFKSKLPRCKGSNKLISLRTITIIESQGSHCYTTTDENLKGIQVCIDPIFH